MFIINNKNNFVIFYSVKNTCDFRRLVQFSVRSFGVRYFLTYCLSVFGHLVFSHSVFGHSCTVIRCWVFRCWVIRCTVIQRSVFQRSVGESWRISTKRASGSPKIIKEKKIKEYQSIFDFKPLVDWSLNSLLHLSHSGQNQNF
jgi:hypothetical protein